MQETKLKIKLFQKVLENFLILMQKAIIFFRRLHEIFF